MKQKRLKDKRRNTINLKNKRTATSAAYNSTKSTTKDYQKNDQIDNKENNGNIDMSMGLEEDKKKLKSKTMDRKQEKLSSSNEAVTSSPTLPTSSSLQPEVFDSSGDNAMSELKKVADMSTDETV